MILLSADINYHNLDVKFAKLEIIVSNDLLSA